jgi:hypothetical protein
MGRPLRKLHHALYLRSDLGDCNIHHDRFGSHFAVKRMDAQRFVSKNARLEKADHKKDAPMVDGWW